MSSPEALARLKALGIEGIHARWRAQVVGFLELRKLRLAQEDTEARELIQMHDDIGALLALLAARPTAEAPEVAAREACWACCHTPDDCKWGGPGSCGVYCGDPKHHECRVCGGPSTNQEGKPPYQHRPDCAALARLGGAR